MKLLSLKIRNFRSYKEEVTINFDDFTALVGKNDIGKSTILEALDIFFNDGKGTIKVDKSDINVFSEESDFTISALFDPLDENVIIDATNETKLEDEFLLNKEKKLEIIKKFTGTGAPKIYIRAYHPTNENCSDLLQKRDSELRKLIDFSLIPCEDRTRNSVMRRSIWKFYEPDLDLDLVELDVTKGDTKSIWDKLQHYLPVYALFQSDRKNSDGDSEIQDPLKFAVSEIIKNENIQEKLNYVAVEVLKKLKEVSDGTMSKLREMDPEIANSLLPVLPETSSLKWLDVFKNVSIASDENIPVNKRGSGTKRLILINFFRSEVERRKKENNKTSIIYAIEEPETSQHSGNQRKLISALKELSETSNIQIIITTHSPVVVKELDSKQIRVIKFADGNSKKDIIEPEKQMLPYSSLNEINYVAFNEISTEYHDELYGHIMENRWLDKYEGEEANTKRLYKRECPNKKNKIQKFKVVLSTYIRHQIHHPENTNNDKYTFDELCYSIEQMRNFIKKKEEELKANI